MTAFAEHLKSQTGELSNKYKYDRRNNNKLDRRGPFTTLAASPLSIEALAICPPPPQKRRQSFCSLELKH